MKDFFARILNTADEYSNNPAIVISNQVHSYQELLHYAYYLSFYFVECKSDDAICVILSDKTLDLYAGMLACFFANVLYTPLNVHSAIEKSELILNSISPKLIFVGDVTDDAISQLLSSVFDATILFTNKNIYDKCKNQCPNNTLIFINSRFENFFIQTETYVEWYMSNQLQPNAYLFFTSGSTGVPKAVPISYKNINAYIAAVMSLFPVSNQDRFMQLSDIAFDISIHEILVSFISGGTLYVYDDLKALNVAKFIARNHITQCIVVPSALAVITEQSQFYHADLRSLRCTLVCGEAFPVAFAKQWHAIAPQSLIVNLYGPTEATVCCTYHIYQPDDDYQSRAILPIGKPFPSVELTLTDKHELMIMGDQVSSGYWNNTTLQFQFDEGRKTMCYFTGDHVTLDAYYGYEFHGRLDDQWQIKGYRIEKNEVENALRSVMNASKIYVTPSFDHHNTISHLIAFSTEKIDLLKHKKQLRRLLPEPAIPIKTIQLDRIPTLSSGKTNYKKLIERAMLC